MSTNEDRAHFSMWAMLAAPLIAGNDLRQMSEETRSILTNREVIAVDQDPLGVQGFRQVESNGLETWYKPLESGDWAVVFLNRTETPRELAVDWRAETVEDELSGRATGFDRHVYRVRDLWAHEDLGTTRERLEATVPPHGLLHLRLIKQVVREGH